MPQSTQLNIFPFNKGNTWVTSTNKNSISDNLCSNALFPVKVGATWMYLNTSDSLGNSIFSNTITALRPDGFTIESNSGNLYGTQDLSCTENGLVAPVTGGGVTIPAFSVQGISISDFNVSYASGLTLPTTIQQNMHWPYELKVSGKFILPGNQSVTMGGVISTNLEAGDIETITVPAGTFSAQRIQAVSTSPVTASFFGIGIPLTATANATFWLAPGIGFNQIRGNRSICRLNVHRHDNSTILFDPVIKNQAACTRLVIINLQT